MSERAIDVFADWVELGGPTRMGLLHARPGRRGEEIFSFEYDDNWLRSAPRQALDPELSLYSGAQYSAAGGPFGAFLDSSPDRWGRVLMRRREAVRARAQGRPPRVLRESDYLLGVHDTQRIGALRFRVDGTFRDDSDELAAPPLAALRELEHASLELEREGVEDDPAYVRWLTMLLAPGSSLGGARPKAGVVDASGHLWIAKFPSRADEHDVGAWELVVHELAGRAGVVVPDARAERFGARHHTFLSRRFDRSAGGGRVHFASAMTLLGRREGDDRGPGSYLDLAECLVRYGAQTGTDLEQLWRRIVFFVCVSNTDDHLRNHGFLLTPLGWVLAPAYDVNANPLGEGLHLDISQSDNAQDLDVVRGVAPVFRVADARATRIVEEVVAAVRSWREVATDVGLSRAECDAYSRAFRVS